MEVESRIARLIVTAGILYGLPIPLMYKYIPLVMSDSIDTKGPFKIIKKVSKDEYQKYDKMTDILCYTLLLFYILTSAGLPKVYNQAIVTMFIYRLIGQVLFHRTGDRKYLFFFPNFFLEVSFLLVAIHTLPDSTHKYIAIFLLLLLKILMEYSHHVVKIFDRQVN